MWLDYDLALHRVGGDRALLAEVGALLLDNAPRQLAAARNALGENDSAGLAHCAHTLQGSLGAVAANAAEQAAHALERAAGAGELAPCVGLLDLLQRETDAALNAVRQWR